MGLPVPLVFTFSPQRLIERIERNVAGLSDGRIA
jgi:hypothetical protein